MKKIIFIVSLLVFGILSHSIAQKKDITGKVVDQSTGKGIEGVNILVDKSKKGTATKKDGTFTISVKSAENILIFSSIGYATQTRVTDKNTDTLYVIMIPAATENTEVVVIGYGTQKKSDLTGAITKFKDEKLDEAPVSRLDQALQGKIAGVQVQNITSEAGAPPTVQVRGISSIYAGASPLVVVDGQPVPDGLAYVNMSDIESIEVLKDAASASIYGSRGASGVILITTKSGMVDKPKFVFKYSIGAKSAYERYDVMTYTEYMNRLFYEAALKATDPSIPTPTGTDIAINNERAGYIMEQQLLGGKGTNWQDQALRKALFQNISLSASGGKGDVKYYISGAYVTDQGLMINSSNNQFNARTKIDINLSSKVKLVLNMNPSYSQRTSPSINYTTFVRYPSFMPVYHTQATIDLIRQIPQWSNVQVGDYAQPRHFNNIYYSGIMPDGSLWDEGPSNTFSPFPSGTNSPTCIMNNTDIYSKIYRLQSSAEFTVKLRKGLDFKSLATVYVNNTNGVNWASANAEADGVVSRGVFTDNTYTDILTEQTLNYSKSIKDHNITAVAGFTSQTTKTNYQQIAGLDFPSDDIRTLNNASIIDKSSTFGTTNTVGLLSYLGRVNYNYKSKYLLSTSFRTDGSSYFGTGNKWGTFPSVSLGWVMGKEDFMKKYNKVVSSLKWRASYGVSGNNRILDFGFLDLLYPANYSFGNGTGSVTPGQATSPTIRSNPDITWESTYQANFGMDLSLFNKVSLTVDYYNSKTDRLLLQQSAMAFTGVPLTWNNIGSLKNNGLEIQLNTTNIKKAKFSWTTAANFSRTRNKILELGKEAYLINEGERNELYMNKVGYPLIQFYGFKTDGIWLSQAQIDQAVANGLTSPLANVFVPGQLKLVDLDGNNVIDNNDRTMIGSPYPDFTWGITNTINYGPFDFTFTFQGSQGGSLINGDPNYDEVKKLVRPYSDNRWISPMYPGDGQTPAYNKAAFNWLLTDYVVEDASYFALREVNIGYKFPDARLKFAKSLRVYVSSQNLYYHMANGYRGINPEARFSTGPYASSLISGYQRGAFPIPRTMVFGVNLTF